MMHSLALDLRVAARRIWRDKLMTLVVVLAIGLTLAANANVFGGMRGLLGSPLPYDEAEQLVYLWQGEPQLTSAAWLTPANYLDLAERSTQLQELAAIRWLDLTLGRDDAPERRQTVRAQAVTSSVFRLLRVEPLAGRVFEDSETLPGAQPVVVIRASVWREQFSAVGGSPDTTPDFGAGDSTLVLNGVPHTIVGLMADEFELIDAQVGVWIPLLEDPSAASRQEGSYFAVGRMAAGAGLETLGSELGQIERQLEAVYPDVNRGLSLHAIRLRDRFVDARVRQLVLIALVAVIGLLLITASNVTNLFYAKSERRGSELATLASLGAEPWRLVRLLVAESMLLGLASGLLGLALAGVGHLLIANSPMWAQVPAAIRPKFDWTVVCSSLALSLVTGLLVGLLPAIKASRGQLMLRSSGAARGGHASDPSRRFFSRGLVVFQMGLSLVLVAATGVLVQSFREMESAPGGYRGEGVITARVAISPVEEDAEGAVVAVLDDVLASVRAHPGILSAAAMSEPPRSPGNRKVEVDVPGTDLPDGQSSESIWLAADENYLGLLEVPLLGGRNFDSRERLVSDPGIEFRRRGALVNRSFAERFLGEREPVGARVRLDGDEAEILGVFADVQQEMMVGKGAVAPVVIVHYAQHELPGLLVAVRGRAAEPGGLMAALRKELDRPDVVVGTIGTLDDLVSSFYVGFRLYASFMGLFGLVALAIAALGTYGVTAYSAARRAFELAVRRALGATNGGIAWLVLREGLLLALGGVLMGLPGVFLVTWLIDSALRTTAPISAWVSVGATLVLVLVGVIGSALPALAAQRLHPADALREC